MQMNLYQFKETNTTKKKLSKGYNGKIKPTRRRLVSTCMYKYERTVKFKITNSLIESGAGGG